MTDRQTTILRMITEGPISANSIATLTGTPQASVRRDVGTLRDQGHNINHAYDNGGLYRLVVA